MAVGTIDRAVLGAIADAIRAQAGTAGRLLPGEMAAAVAALDGSREGEAASYPAGEGRGLVSDTVFAAIADAIRVQNGLTEKYTPSEMAGAILALEWDMGLKPRAVLLEGWVLELNYLDRRRGSGGERVLMSWDVPAAGVSSAGQLPWADDRAKFAYVRVDASFRESGVASAAYWFLGCVNLLEVSGFENLAGVTDFTQAFTSCAKLHTIWCSGGFDAPTVTGALALSGCNRLVGSEGFVPEPATGADALKLGAGGVLTDPADDRRGALWGTLFRDGTVEVGVAAPTLDGSRSIREQGRLYARAEYRAVGCTPWAGANKDVVRVTLNGDLAEVEGINLNYWFYGCSAMTGVAGMGSLRGLSKMRHAFNGCAALGSLDLRGVDPSALTDLFYAFAGCSALKTITADASWELPEGATGMQAFYQCTSLVGGNGTAFDAKSAGAGMMRIDKEGQAGYLTAG